VKGLVEAQGGSVEGRSDGRGRGSEFVIRLPLHQGEIAPAPAPRPVEAPMGQLCRVLVVEDNRDAAESLRLLLQLAGHEVAVAGDGPSALELARSHRADAVICDVGLPPPMNGYQVAEAMRADPALRSLFLVALTGLGQEDDQERARRAGFDVHLIKPAEPAALKRLLARAPRSH
jgi:CheY-like chemotaxis protein